MNLTGNRCRCTVCGETFSTPGNFDRHRSGPWDARVCGDPASVGLIKSTAGLWKAPPPATGKYVSNK